ncbi:2-phospho-L-lactate transferase [Paraconexibacter algicola]|uniref:2-phospho-L-lactate transferase n=1 Tax=Paraconexibacter algicola TaxID=2133960 RepID=A0A2T4UDM9_9ACTN|nr:2-phospho-L-lactate transferase [Paraconexibacter algicola]PTL55609.1 2-phospho-L-lactate transferase [Paraconexibacter algicola]
MSAGPVVVLAGGTGGAKLARGMLDVVGDDLVVVANTADDVELYGAYVSPDPDLCAFWLADRIDARGWGLDGDTFHVMDGLRELGREVWFNLGDRDLAVGLRRAERLAAGDRLTEALHELTTALGLTARVLPMSDAPVRTRVRTEGTWAPFQEFMIRRQGRGPIEDVAFDGIEAATPPPEVLDAIAAARAIVIGPSNPVISIRPILDVPGMREALAASPAAVVAVSPIVGGTVVKGPTEPFLAWAGHPLNASGIAAHYGGVLDGLVTDEAGHGTSVPMLQTDTMMGDAAARQRLARQTLDFTEGLR